MDIRDLKGMCRMLNETKTGSIVLKNVKVLKAAKRTNDLFAKKRARATLVVEEPGVKWEFELECSDAEIGPPIVRG